MAKEKYKKFLGKYSLLSIFLINAPIKYKKINHKDE
jgi:hypothetical protein